nr:hypothetical protein Iba_chr13bCG9440 [Ipomoea batatas]
MEQDPTKFFNFSKLTNKYPNDIQHQASGVMMFIINNKMDPPGGEPIWSFYSREDKLDYLKGFLKPLAMETSESSLEKAPAPDEPVDPTFDTPSDISAHTLVTSPVSVAPNISPNVFYGPHLLKSMFSKLDLFSVLNDHRKTKSLSNRLSIPVTIPEHNPSKHEPIVTLHHLSPLIVKTPSEYEAGQLRSEQEIPEDEEYEVLLSQIGRPKEKEKGKRKQLKLV